VADIKVRRDHALGMAKARKLAFTWAEQAEEKFEMTCNYEEGDARDVVTFTRTGVRGTLVVTASRFVIEAHLGLLFGAFKDRIEGEVVKYLDTLLAKETTRAKKR
jgi:putative polyhydroxyalkanoate system protein